VITVARTGPTSLISRKYSTNATAVQTTARPASAPSTCADGMACGQVSAASGAYTTAAKPRQAAVTPRPSTPASFLAAMTGPAA
jgi:hypothetical protein